MFALVEFLPQAMPHDNDRLHTTVRPTEVITNLGCIVSPHPAYGPDPAPSDYRVCGR